MTDPITPNRIVGVAVDLLARGGLHALAMRRIANELGVQQSALYWHFANKQLLLARVADHIVEPVGVGDAVPDGWSARTEALAWALRRELLRYPDGAELVATAFAFRLGGDQPFGQFTTELTVGGLTPPDAQVAASVLWHFVLGYVTDEQQHRQAAALGAIDADVDAAPSASGDDRFDAALGLILMGIDVRIRESSTAATSHRDALRP